MGSQSGIYGLKYYDTVPDYVVPYMGITRPLPDVYGSYATGTGSVIASIEVAQ